MKKLCNIFSLNEGQDNVLLYISKIIVWIVFVYGGALLFVAATFATKGLTVLALFLLALIYVVYKGVRNV